MNISKKIVLISGAVLSLYITLPVLVVMGGTLLISYALKSNKKDNKGEKN